MSQYKKRLEELLLKEAIKSKLARYRNMKPLEQVPEQVIALTEELPYFELAGYRLEKQNHGAPGCSEIKINEKNASRTKPQAWSKEITGVTHWFYNFPGAVAEAKHLGKKVPTIDEWMEMLESVTGNAEEKAQTLGIPLAGYRDAGNGTFCGEGGYANLWSSSEYGSTDAHYAYFEHGLSDANWNGDDRAHGMSIRFFSDK